MAAEDSDSTDGQGRPGEPRLWSCWPWRGDPSWPCAVLALLAATLALIARAGWRCTRATPIARRARVRRPRGRRARTRTRSATRSSPASPRPRRSSSHPAPARRGGPTLDGGGRRRRRTSADVSRALPRRRSAPARRAVRRGGSVRSDRAARDRGRRPARPRCARRSRARSAPARRRGGARDPVRSRAAAAGWRPASSTARAVGARGSRRSRRSASWPRMLRAARRGRVRAPTPPARRCGARRSAVALAGGAVVAADDDRPRGRALDLRHEPRRRRGRHDLGRLSRRPAAVGAGRRRASGRSRPRPSSPSARGAWRPRGRPRSRRRAAPGPARAGGRAARARGAVAVACPRCRSTSRWSRAAGVLRLQRPPPRSCACIRTIACAVGRLRPVNRRARRDSRSDAPWRIADIPRGLVGVAVGDERPLAGRIVGWMFVVGAVVTTLLPLLPGADGKVADADAADRDRARSSGACSRPAQVDWRAAPGWVIHLVGGARRARARGRHARHRRRATRRRASC